MPAALLLRARDCGRDRPAGKRGMTGGSVSGSASGRNEPAAMPHAGCENRGSASSGRGWPERGLRRVGCCPKCSATGHVLFV